MPPAATPYAPMFIAPLGGREPVDEELRARLVLDEDLQLPRAGRRRRERASSTATPCSRRAWSTRSCSRRSGRRDRPRRCRRTPRARARGGDRRRDLLTEPAGLPGEPGVTGRETARQHGRAGRNGYRRRRHDLAVEVVALDVVDRAAAGRRPQCGQRARDRLERCHVRAPAAADVRRRGGRAHHDDAAAREVRGLRAAVHRRCS